MPYKHSASRRYHTLLRVLSHPEVSFKVRIWLADEVGLCRRGSLTLWIEDAALECWQPIGPSGQARYAGLALKITRRTAAIQTSPMVRALLCSSRALVATAFACGSSTTSAGSIAFSASPRVIPSIAPKAEIPAASSELS
jgi:hypothetical protein